MNEHELSPDRIEAIARDAARDEAESVLDETTTADDGKDWSVRKLMDRFEIGRRPAMIAFGLLAAGSVLDPVEAVLRAVSQPADAQTNDLTVPGDLDVGGTVSTDNLTITSVLSDLKLVDAGSTNIPASSSETVVSSYNESGVLFGSAHQNGSSGAGSGQIRFGGNRGIQIEISPVGDGSGMEVVLHNTDSSLNISVSYVIFEYVAP